MSDLTIKGIKNKRDGLEQQIRTLMAIFEHDTGLEIRDIHFERRHAVIGEGTPLIDRVYVDAEIGRLRVV